MAMQRIENGFARGLEIVGLITPGILAPRVTEALESYRKEGKNEATADEIRKKIREIHPPGRFFPVSNGCLPDAIALLEEKEQITSKLVQRADKTGGIQDVLAYSVIEKPQQP
jgi:hypothetical protein